MNQANNFESVVFSFVDSCIIKAINALNHGRYRSIIMTDFHKSNRYAILLFLLKDGINFNFKDELELDHVQFIIDEMNCVIIDDKSIKDKYSLSMKYLEEKRLLSKTVNSITMEQFMESLSQMYPSKKITDDKEEIAVQEYVVVNVGITEPAYADVDGESTTKDIEKNENDNDMKNLSSCGEWGGEELQEWTIHTNDVRPCMITEDHSDKNTHYLSEDSEDNIHPDAFDGFSVDESDEGSVSDESEESKYTRIYDLFVQKPNLSRYQDLLDFCRGDVDSFSKDEHDEIATTIIEYFASFTVSEIATFWKPTFEIHRIKSGKLNNYHRDVKTLAIIQQVYIDMQLHD